MSDELRGPRGEYDWWESFVKGHEGDLEDALLRPLAELGDVTTPVVAPVPEAQDVTVGWTEEQVAAEVERLTNVHAKLIGFNPHNKVAVYGFGVGPQLRDLFIDAWAHWQEHQCNGGREALDRLMEQLIAVMFEAKNGESS